MSEECTSNERHCGKSDSSTMPVTSRLRRATSWLPTRRLGDSATNYIKAPGNSFALTIAPCEIENGDPIPLSLCRAYVSHDAELLHLTHS